MCPLAIDSGQQCGDLMMGQDNGDALWLQRPSDFVPSNEVTGPVDVRLFSPETVVQVADALTQRVEEARSPNT